MISFKQWLIEKLTKPQRDWVKSNIKGFDWKKMHYDWFGGKYRLYFPLSTIDRVAIPSKVKDYVESKGYVIVDYIGNKAKKKDGNQEIRIGKLVSDNPEIETIYKLSKNNTTKESSLMLCISRLPTDYAGQSTDRSWTSCKSISSGQNCKYIPKEIKEGWLIGYIIRSDDKLIKKPLGRMLAIPYTSTDGKNDVKYVVREESQYGVTNTEAFKIFEKWLEEKQGTFDSDTYELSTKGYEDSYPRFASGNREKLLSDVITDWCNQYGWQFEIVRDDVYCSPNYEVDIREFIGFDFSELIDDQLDYSINEDTDTIGVSWEKSITRMFDIGANSFKTTKLYKLLHKYLDNVMKQELDDNPYEFLKKYKYERIVEYIPNGYFEKMKPEIYNYIYNAFCVDYVGEYKKMVQEELESNRYSTQNLSYVSNYFPVELKFMNAENIHKPLDDIDADELDVLRWFDNHIKYPDIDSGDVNLYYYVLDGYDMIKVEREIDI